MYNAVTAAWDCHGATSILPLPMSDWVLSSGAFTYAPVTLTASLSLPAWQTQAQFARIATSFTVPDGRAGVAVNIRFVFYATAAGDYSFNWFSTGIAAGSAFPTCINGGSGFTISVDAGSVNRTFSHVVSLAPGVTTVCGSGATLATGDRIALALLSLAPFPASGNIYLVGATAEY
jgi:hypothetical protein